MLYAALRVLDGVAALLLRVWPLRLLLMVQHHRDLLERRTHHVFVWMLVAGWVVRSLNYVGLLQPAWSLGEAVLAVELGRGAIRTTVGEVLEFVLTSGWRIWSPSSFASCSWKTSTLARR